MLEVKRIGRPFDRPAARSLGQRDGPAPRGRRQQATSEEVPDKIDVLLLPELGVDAGSRLGAAGSDDVRSQSLVEQEVGGNFMKCVPQSPVHLPLVACRSNKRAQAIAVREPNAETTLTSLCASVIAALAAPILISRLILPRNA